MRHGEAARDAKGERADGQRDRVHDDRIHGIEQRAADEVVARIRSAGHGSPCQRRRRHLDAAPRTHDHGDHPRDADDGHDHHRGVRAAVAERDDAHGHPHGRRVQQHVGQRDPSGLHRRRKRQVEDAHADHRERSERRPSSPLDAEPAAGGDRMRDEADPAAERAPKRHARRTVSPPAKLGGEHADDRPQRRCAEHRHGGTSRRRPAPTRGVERVEAHSSMPSADSAADRAQR